MYNVQVTMYKRLKILNSHARRTGLRPFSTLNSKGFTLVELLTVILIVGIVATLVLISVNPTQVTKKNNDNQRITDLQILSQAVESYYQDNNLTYPDAGAKATTRKSNLLPSGSSGPLQFSNGQGWIAQDFGDRLEKLPTDPLNVACNIYRYRVSADGKYYKLDTILEYLTAKMANSSDGGTDSTHYEVGNDPITDPINMGACP